MLSYDEFGDETNLLAGDKRKSQGIGVSMTQTPTAHSTQLALAVSDLPEVPTDDPFSDVIRQIFPPSVDLIPKLNELYELVLAYGEYSIMPESQLVERAAYFLKVNGVTTNHFAMCSGAPLKVSANSSMRLRSFFKANQFKTGYATHGLFPYRGKFHPQMIKGILNIIGLTPGMTVLDPMGGSGTVAIEAATMGIDSVSYDLSPFCTMMTSAKARGLRLEVSELTPLLDRSADLKDTLARGLSDSLPERVVQILILAYLDSRGYAERSQNKSKRDLFKEILTKYATAIDKFARVREDLSLELGVVTAKTADARDLPLKDETIDGIVFSPPYSFAVDYIENDESHLRYLDISPAELRGGMIGLHGPTARKRVALYFDDMRMVLSECERVLRNGRYCVLVVGSNTNQLSSILRTDDPEAISIETRLSRIAYDLGLTLVKRIPRQITGVMNVMRDEHILVFKKAA